MSWRTCDHGNPYPASISKIYLPQITSAGRRLQMEPLEERRLLAVDLLLAPDLSAAVSGVTGANEDIAAYESSAVGLPSVIGVAPLGAPAGNQMVIAVDFSEVMAPASAEDVGNYRVTLENGTELAVVAVQYADAADQHRATLTLEGAGPITNGTYHLEVNGHNLRSLSGQAMSQARDELAVHVMGENSLVFVGQQADGAYGELRDPLSLGWGVPEHLVSTDFDGDGIADMVTTVSDEGDDSDKSVLFFGRSAESASESRLARAAERSSRNL